MELTLSARERESLQKMEFHVCKTIGISNDLASWIKEYRAYKDGHRVRNAILFLRKTGLTTHEAIRFLKERVLQFQRELLKMREEILLTPDVSKDMMKCVDAYMWMVSGNELWGWTCRRYHSYLYL
jgi:aristolochene synthase